MEAPWRPPPLGLHRGRWGGESTELAPPPVLSAPRLASVGPSVASAASQSDVVAAAGGAASTAACPSSTMAEGAERYRELWEDEMFARQVPTSLFLLPKLLYFRNNHARGGSLTLSS